MSDHTDTTLTDTERAALKEHRRNEVPEPGSPFPVAFWRVKCEGLSCEFYAERPTWFEACTAHEDHLVDVLAPIVAARVAAARAEAWDEGHARCAYHVDGCYSVNPYRALIEGADQ